MVGGHLISTLFPFLVFFRFTVVLPPQAFGAPVLLLLREPLHPPLELAVASQLVNAVFIASCVCHDAAVVLVGQVSDTAGEAATVKVAAHVVTVGAQLLVYVKVTVVLPPQAFGAPVLLLLREPLHPPLELAVASQLVNAVFIASCV